MAMLISCHAPEDPEGDPNLHSIYCLLNQHISYNICMKESVVRDMSTCPDILFHETSRVIMALYSVRLNCFDPNEIKGKSHSHWALDRWSPHRHRYPSSRYARTAILGPPPPDRAFGRRPLSCCLGPGWGDLLSTAVCLPNLATL